MSRVKVLCEEVRIGGSLSSDRLVWKYRTFGRALKDVHEVGYENELQFFAQRIRQSPSLFCDGDGGTLIERPDRRYIPSGYKVHGPYAAFGRKS